jgi:ankyrin repeat protein
MLNGNQYIRLEGTIEDIANMKIKFDYKTYDYKELIDLEIGTEEPNVLIYHINNIKKTREEIQSEYINIYSKIKIIISSFHSFNDFTRNLYGDGYKKLPKHIEYLILDDTIYKLDNEFEMMEFMAKKTFKNYIKNEVIKNERWNDENRYGETALFYCVSTKRKTDELTLELLQRMSAEKIYTGIILLKAILFNKWRIVKELIKKISSKILNDYSNTYYETIIHLLIEENADEDIILDIIPKITDKNINRIENLWNNTVLQYACKKNLEKVAIALISRMNDNSINNIDNNNETTLHYACMYNMDKIAIKLINRMSDSAINQYSKDNITALHYATYNGMSKVAMCLLMRMKKEIINMMDNCEMTALDYCKSNNMKRVIRIIRLKQK